MIYSILDILSRIIMQMVHIIESIEENSVKFDIFELFFSGLVGWILVGLNFNFSWQAVLMLAVGCFGWYTYHINKRE